MTEDEEDDDDDGMYINKRISAKELNGEQEGSCVIYY